MRPAAWPEMADDLSGNGLADGLKSQIEYLKSQKGGSPEFGFGPRVIDRASYILALEYLLSAIESDPSGERYIRDLKEDFEPYEVYGQEHWGEVFITSYFEPVINGSKKPLGQFKQPLYGPPKDLVEIEADSFPTLKPALEFMNPRPGLLRGRLLPMEKDKIPRITAYPDRAGINREGLKDLSSILAYVDPVDAFVLEIQGSGVVKFSDGKEMIVGYAAQNGHPYYPIGRSLFSVIPKEKMTMFALENHLRSLPDDESKKLMELNPSYVFFRPLPKRGVTYLGNELVTGRTIATDTRFFPKGVLALLQFEKPVFASESDTEPVRWDKVSRFVFDQDTGGAIRGPGRVDLFSGRGMEGKQTAAVMKNKGHLVYLVPKITLIEKLTSGRVLKTGL
jgi:membrane-bound lytic murein transglycosylase A